MGVGVCLNQLPTHPFYLAIIMEYVIALVCVCVCACVCVCVCWEKSVIFRTI